MFQELTHHCQLCYSPLLTDSSGSLLLNWKAWIKSMWDSNFSGLPFVCHQPELCIAWTEYLNRSSLNLSVLQILIPCKIPVSPILQSFLYLCNHLVKFTISVLNFKHITGLKVTPTYTWRETQRVTDRQIDRDIERQGGIIINYLLLTHISLPGIIIFFDKILFVVFFSILTFASE